MRRGALSHLILTSLVLWPALCTGLEQRDNTLSWQGREFAVHFSPDIDTDLLLDTATKSFLDGVEMEFKQRD